MHPSSHSCPIDSSEALVRLSNTWACLAVGDNSVLGSGICPVRVDRICSPFGNWTAGPSLGSLFWRTWASR